MHLCNSTLCKPTTSSQAGFCFCLVSCCFYSSQLSQNTRQHATLSFSFVTISLNFSLAIVSSCFYFSSPLHQMVYSNTSNALQQEHLPCLHLLLVAWLCQSSSDSLNSSSTVQLHRWAVYSHLACSTPLSAEQRLPQGNRRAYWLRNQMLCAVASPHGRGPPLEAWQARDGCPVGRITTNKV